MKKAGDKAARQEVKSHCIYALSYQSYSQTFLYFLVIKYQVLRLFGKPGMSNRRPRGQNWPGKDSKLVHWKALEYMKKGIILDCILYYTAFPTDKDLPHHDSYSNKGMK